MKGMKPVKVYSCSDRVQADMLTEALKREGIPAYAESKGSGDYLNIYMGTSVFGETIYVDENDADRAKEIIEGMTQADSDVADTIEDQGPARARQDKKNPCRKDHLPDRCPVSVPRRCSPDAAQSLSGMTGNQKNGSVSV